MAKSSDRTPFFLRCNAAGSGNFETSCNQFSVAAGQKITRAGIEEIWEFVLMTAKEAEDGTQIIRVLLCHPDWDEPLEIAAIESDLEQMKIELAVSHSRTG